MLLWPTIRGSSAGWKPSVPEWKGFFLRNPPFFLLVGTLFLGQVRSCQGSLLELFSFGYILFFLGGFGPLGGGRYATQALRESCYPCLVKPFQLCQDL